MASGEAFQAELLSLQLALVEIGTEEETLRRASELLTPQLFDDVVEDRLIARICGYPSCDKHLEAERAPRCGLHATFWIPRMNFLVMQIAWRVGECGVKRDEPPILLFAMVL